MNQELFFWKWKCESFFDKLESSLEAGKNCELQELIGIDNLIVLQPL